ncbi:hypothetical protein SLEP1_g7085 [Rubroshorea leprosula]|uniref:Uncharacterized protein n=1 Tax=Rubroshorea leprosula TaxID=152421 RepID=A0AAV5I6A8_9ROSI|nr:hypothetical protein SLEP1_g7085 [Rubroshorea leprosula]
MASPPPKGLERSSFLRTEAILSYLTLVDEQSKKETEIETVAVEREKVAAKKPSTNRKSTGKRKATSHAASIVIARSKGQVSAKPKATKRLSISIPSTSMREAKTSESKGSDDSPMFLREEKGKKERNIFLFFTCRSFFAKG